MTMWARQGLDITSSLVDEVTVDAEQLSAIAKQLFSHAPIVQRTFQTLRPYICPFDRLIELVPRDASVLDIGCGAGLFLMLLAESGRIQNGVGFDSSESGIAIAKAAAKRLTAHVLQFDHCRVQDTWPQGEFDVVTLVDVMHHVAQSCRTELLTQAVARVRPGGLFIYKDMCCRPRWRAWMNRLHDLVVAKEWIRYEPLADVRCTIERLGLQLLSAESINLWWYGHELLQFRKPA